MKRILIVLVNMVPLFAMCQPGTMSASQTSFSTLLKDIRGTPIPINASYQVTGSLFYPKDYCEASIKVKNGKKYDSVSVKLNLQDNDVYVKFGDGIEMIATIPLENIDFSGCENNKKTTFKSGFPAIEKQTDKSFYQVLSSGNLLLLKYANLSYRDEVPYGTATVTRNYETQPSYYAFSPEKGIIRLKDNGTVLGLVPAQKAEIEKFVNDQGIKVKRENDLVKLFDFINSLK